MNDNNSQKPNTGKNVLGIFMEKLKTFLFKESPLNSFYDPVSKKVGEKPAADGVDVVLQRMAVVGLFDTIKVIADAGKSSTGSLGVGGAALPTSLIRVYLNGIVNACALVEECLERQEERAVSPQQQQQQRSTKPEETAKGSSSSAVDDNPEVSYEGVEGDDDDDERATTTTSKGEAVSEEEEEFEEILRGFQGTHGSRKGQA